MQQKCKKFWQKTQKVYIFASLKIYFMKKTIPFLILMILVFGLKAQSVERWVIGSAGGSYYDGVHDFEMDFTVGELMVTTETNVNNTLTQGFQQPQNPLSWVSVQDYSENPSHVILYPNPVIDQLNLSIQNAKSGEYRIMVYDVIGQLLIDNTISAGFDGTARANLDFNSYATGNYYVRIIHEKKTIQTGKIIKIDQ
jgi:hypothetical protein